ncbi:hypothetical protein [Lysinibacillus odysseyi]|uniref:Sodium:potassium antiporter n=1 Tax=Lysinibacillus odysseyi 34hs-1 = NBRC 100172 TaxID=1220589 RepID=A0A0A3IWV1_9BACI|nr:hypothetical protein [Lysinibacillus odysseyi]KGR87930.1 hypothetical protein CD32_02555 [Lysinibacillus odysseyi 34hs-1 = NBRC 100172]
MMKDFRVLSALCAASALFISLGFFLTETPVLLQILLLVIGLVIGIITFIGLVKLFIAQQKGNV